jgi:hypothetical protein
LIRSSFHWFDLELFAAPALVCLTAPMTRPFFGPRGSSNAQLAISLSRSAIERGDSVLFTQAPVIAASLAKAHGEGHLEGRLAHCKKPKLLIDDKACTCFR